MLMPMYEFRCETCGARFEALVPVGTESVECRVCAGEQTVRMFSAPGSPLHLVKTRGDARKQEARNARLQSDARTRFKEARRKAREGGGRGGPPAGNA